MQITHIKQHFNPRPPWGGRLNSGYQSAAVNSFQSTPSVGRATAAVEIMVALIHISIHALRGEGDSNPPLSVSEPYQISIHALRGEGDNYCLNGGEYDDEFQSTPSVGRATTVAAASTTVNIFQSTPSVGRATNISAYQADEGKISIHALRGEGDTSF